MREFFLDKLESLKLLNGLNQFENMFKRDDFDEQLNILLDSLVSATKTFGYLSDEKKKQVISKAMMTDETFTSLNKTKVYQWLSKYWTSLTPAEIYDLTRPKSEDKDYKPLPPEEAQEYIEKWKKIHASIEVPLTKPVKVSVIASDGRKQHKLKQEVVDCHKCKNDEKKRAMCPICMGHGKIKRTIL